MLYATFKTQGEKGDYLYIAIGADAVWMRNYLKGL